MAHNRHMVHSKDRSNDHSHDNAGGRSYSADPDCLSAEPHFHRPVQTPEHSAER